MIVIRLALVALRRDRLRTGLSLLSLALAVSSVITVVLGNPIKRGIAVAITWLNPKFRALPPADSAKAFAHLDLASEARAVLSAFERMQKRMRPVATLGLVTTALR